MHRSDGSTVLAFNHSDYASPTTTETVIDRWNGRRQRDDIATHRVLVVDHLPDARRIVLCGLDPAMFQGVVDPASVIEVTAREGLRNGVSVQGAVALGQRYIQRTPLRHGEAVTVHRATNAAASPLRYEIDGAEQYRIQMAIEGGLLAR